MMGEPEIKLPLPISEMYSSVAITLPNICVCVCENVGMCGVFHRKVK